MNDPTELPRRLLCEVINGDPQTRETLEEVYGQVWDTSELNRDFEVVAFLAPFVLVRRRADGVEMSLAFQHMPRFYFANMEV